MKRFEKRDHERAQKLTEIGVITQETACDGKVQHTSRNEARRAAKRIANKTGRKVSTYKCPFCSLWHITKHKHGEGAQEC